jgi:hypothetical protein
VTAMLPETSDRFGQSLRRLRAGQLADGSGASTTIADLAQRYSYVFPDARALDLLASIGPLVEMGAGTGYWAYRLQARGVQVLAFDQAPPDQDRPNRYHRPTPTWTRVLPGDTTVLEDHFGRALFLCWPPLFSALGDCLSFYRGDTVALIGDGGYRTARLDGLDQGFRLTAGCRVQALDPHPDAVATLGIWQRRQD